LPLDNDEAVKVVVGVTAAVQVEVVVVVVVVLGACQKLPHPAKNPAPIAAANINPAQLLILIAAPRTFSYRLHPHP
jgi:hypothetical protein